MMRCITIWQPYASLIIAGTKKIETRSWNTIIRGRIAIHAARKRDSFSLGLMDTPEFQEGLKAYDTIGRGKTWITDINNTFGCIVGTVEIVDCRSLVRLAGSKYDTPKERAFGDWREGRWGWILRDPVLFENPVPAKGTLGFWNWEALSS